MTGEKYYMIGMDEVKSIIDHYRSYFAKEEPDPNLGMNYGRNDIEELGPIVKVFPDIEFSNSEKCLISILNPYKPALSTPELL